MITGSFVTQTSQIERSRCNSPLAKVQSVT